MAGKTSPTSAWHVADILDVIRAPLTAGCGGGGGGGGGGGATTAAAGRDENLDENNNTRPMKLEAPVFVQGPNFRRLFRKKKVDPSVVNKEYLELCLQLVRAEYYQFFKQAVAQAPSPGWRNRACHIFKVKAGRIADTNWSMKDAQLEPGMYDVGIERAFDCRLGGAEVANIANLKGHLVIYRENLFIIYVMKLTCECKPRALFRYKCGLHKDATPVLHMRYVAMLSEFVIYTSQVRSGFHNSRLRVYIEYSGNRVHI
jgi:hypothetical protein